MDLQGVPAEGRGLVRILTVPRRALDSEQTEVRLWAQACGSALEGGRGRGFGAVLVGILGPWL